MLKDVRAFFRQIAADFRKVFSSRYTYLVLGVLVYLFFIHGLYISLGSGFGGWSFGGQGSYGCPSLSNTKILLVMFGSLLFVVFAMRGLGEAVQAMDMHFHRRINPAYHAARRAAIMYLSLSGGIGIALVGAVARLC